VTWAADGEAALRLAAEDPPSVVVLDLLMPGLDGLELVERLRIALQDRPAAVILWNVPDLTAEERRRLESLAHAIVMNREAGPAALLEELRRRAPVRRA
jgi:CheY-like chemotaxis protein